MKRLILLLSILMLSITSLMAQTVKIYFKDGDTRVFEIAKIDSIVCSNDTIEDAIVEDGPSSVSPEISITDVDVKAYMASLYSSLVKFETAQLYLEALRTGKFGEESYQHETISPNSNVIQETWTAGYQTINRCNQFISLLPSLDGSFDHKPYWKEALIIRAFTYYNMTQLWGALPLIVEPITDTNLYISRSDQSTVLGVIRNDLKDVVSSLMDDELNNGEFRFNKASAKMLLAEVEMLLGNKDHAYDLLQTHSTRAQENYFRLDLNYMPEENIYWGYLRYLQTEKTICIYTPSMAELLVKEIEGTTEDLVSSWQEYNQAVRSEYGYWAALKRMGKAEEATGCQPYMLLMPLPERELMMNNKITQNPGWSNMTR